MKKGILAILVFLSLSFEAVALDPNGFERFTHIGHVFARSKVKTSGGGPVWAEYNDNGGYSQLHALNDIEGTVLDKGRVLNHKVLFEDFKARMNGKVEIYTRDQFTDVAFELKTSDDRLIKGLPVVPYDAVVVVVPAKSERLSDFGPNLEYYAFPFDIATTPLPTSTEGSVFFDETGAQLYESNGRIGPMTAYYKKEGQEFPDASAEYESDQLSTLKGINSQGVELLNPIIGAHLTANSGYFQASNNTELDGSYRLQGALSPCPGFSYDAAIEGWLNLHYSSFSPRGTPVRSYYLKKTGYHLCFGETAYPPDFSLVGLMVQLHAQGIVAGAGENIVTLNYAVAVSVLSGVVFLPPSISVGGETSYSAEATDSTLYMVSDDYDGDGEVDEVKRGDLDEDGLFVESADGNSYGVFFSTSAEESEQPDITRIIDVAPNFVAEGLLSSISEEDLAQTDIYVFRESTGQLITEINGLEDFSLGDVRQSDVGNEMFSFSVAVRGPEDQHSFAARFNDGFMSWQADNKMNPDLQRFQADHLRPGETLRVVAINRPTGYIGSVTAKMGTPTLGGYIGTYIPPILLGPPNLKVWATRRYQQQGLLDNSDAVRKTISNGGAATTDDYVIEVHTEWMDNTGYPLPVGLAGKGYTGRLTKQVGEGGNYDGSVKEFDINPGRQMQLLKFSGGEPVHYYFQVNGFPSSEQNDFTTGGQTAPELAHRPSRYVPVKVPLYWEQGTINDRIAIRNSDLEDVDEYDVEPQFYWTYRPEMSFSTVDVLISSIEEEKEGEAETINLLDTDVPVVSGSSDFVKLLFELVGSEYDRITSFDGEQEFIFALGAQEIQVNINKGEGEEQQISFSNLEHLSSLEVEDYLTMSLYLNQDSQNTLWEWGFENLIVTSRDADNDLETDDIYYVSADDPVVPMIAILSGYSGRESELKKPMTLRWSADNGDLSVEQEVNDTTGIFKTELTMPAQAGQRANLTAELAGSDNPIDFKIIEVVPGAPANIVINKISGPASLGVLGSAEQEYEIIVTDAYGNIVQDGTSVTYSLEGYATTIDSETATTSGKATVTVTGTERFDDAIKMTVTSGSANKVIDLTSAELIVSLEAPTEMTVGETQQVDITVVNPVGSTEGMEVTVSAPYLGVEEQDVLLDENGQATITLLAPPAPANTYVHARVGFSGAQRQEISIVAPDAIIHADNYRPLMGESTQAGSYAYDRFDGTRIDLGYEVEKSLTLQATAGDVITAQLGDAYYPNQMPQLALALDASSIIAFNSDTPKDDTGQHSLTVSGVMLDGSSLYGAGSSTRFDGSASITTSASGLATAQRPNWALAIKPEEAGTLLNLGGGQSLSIAGGELVYRITTSDGTYQVRKTVQMDQWQKVAARVTDSQLELYVDDLSTPVTKAYSGSLQAGSGSLTIGNGYTGLMQELRFYDSQSQPLLAINNASGTTSIQADSTGSANITVNSLGNLNANGEALGLTYVHLVHNGERVHIPVISEDAFKQVAGAAANIGLAGPPLAFNSNPDYNITDPWAPRNLPFSSVMPQAQAFGWLDALDFIIPVSSIITITEQIGRIGTEEFDPVALIIAGLDVALIFSGPLRGPLKIAFDPLAKLISNPATQKLAKILGPFFGNIIEKVAKSRSTDPILNLLPFLMIVGEIAADEEAREAIPIIIDAINSSEDLQVWFDYFNLPDDGWEGDTQPQLDLELASLDSSALPLGMLIPQAYAAGKPKRLSGSAAAKKITRTLAALKKGEITSKEAAAHITRSMDDIIYAAKNIPDARSIATATQTLIAGGALLATKGGVRRVRDLLKGNNGPEKMRTPILLQLAAIAYMESKIGCAEAGCIGPNTQLARGFRSLYLKAFATIATGEYKTQNTVNGSQYHLVMAALLHAWGELGKSPYGKLVSIEQETNIYLQSRSGKAEYVTPRVIRPDESGDFKRMIDLVTQKGTNKPQFIEVKSYLGVKDNKERTESQIKASFSIWEYKPTNSKQKPHKQYLLDRIMATDNKLIEDDVQRDFAQQASEIHWFFQKFKLKTRSSLTDKQMEVIRNQLAQNASGENDKISASLGYKKYAAKASKTQAGKDIKRFGLTTIIEDSGSDMIAEIFNLDALSDDEKAKEIERIQKAVFALIDET
jgi:hypothetical protein